MEVRTWRSFSCNNSGRFHLVAEFPGEAEAAEAARVLRQHLAAAADERAEMDDEDRWSNEGVTEAGIEFGVEHGIEWPGWIVHGDGEDEQLEIEHAGAAVVVTHIYCHGFGAHLGEFFRAKDGYPTEQIHGDPHVSLILRRPDGARGDALVEELDRIFTAGGREHTPTHRPWSNTEISVASGFNDGQWVGYHAPFYVATLSRLRDLLETRAESYRITLDRYEDLERFRSIALARCPECHHDHLRFVDAATHDLPADQLACESCGGMFDIDVP